MKKIFFLTALLCASLMAWANTKYCHEEINSTNNNGSVYMTCKKTSNDNEYQIKFEGTSSHPLKAINACSVGINDINGQVGGSTLTFDFDATGNGSAVATFTCTTTPAAPYVAYIVFGLAPGELVLNEFPKDMDWTATCEQEECSDKTAPTISAVAKSDITHNSATLTITATDNVGGSGISSYIVKNGEVPLVSTSSNVITLTGLSAETEYNLNVYAKDDCGNTSSAFAVNFTTESFHYCDFPTGHLSDANFGNANGRILLTIRKISANSVGVTVKPNNGGIDVFDLVRVEINSTGQDLGSIGGSTPTNTEIVFEGLTSLDFSIVVRWHHSTWDDVNGRWTTNSITVEEGELCTESPATAIDNVESSEKARKVLENGQLIIIKNGVRYNALGVEVR